MIGYQGWFIYNLEKSHKEEKKDLLNRIMARDYPVFVNGEVIKEQAKKEPSEVYLPEQGIPIV